ncbi:DUF4157 domain-containing protein [Streptomyces sp. NPDC059863]|uniref:eCIS core domain-containing protein n=1 Tax=unclassified Streptomyces TaxID=2593676 RepID=UPI0036589524
MRAHDQGHESEHEHGHGHEHEHDETFRSTAQGSATDARESAQTSYLFKAAAAGRPDVVGAAGLSSLQRSVGNSAVGTMLSRDAAPEEEPTPEAHQDRSPVHDVISSGGGSPLDTDTRTDMESRMGADFSDVRVHTDAAAHESAKGVGARAYTVGNHVVFQRESYDPSSPDGRTTLAHELTHVVQQRNGPVEGSEAPGGIRVSDPSDRFEQEAVANADRVLSEPSPTPTPTPSPESAPTPPSSSAPPSAPAPAPVTTDTAAPVQRQATEDEDEEPANVQGSFVQRADEGSEEEEEAPPT